MYAVFGSRTFQQGTGSPRSAQGVSEGSGLGRDIRQAFGRIVPKPVGPSPGRLLQYQVRAHLVAVRVRQRVAAPWAVLGP
jgi:hypothetical protein